MKLLYIKSLTLFTVILFFQNLSSAQCGNGVCDDPDNPENCIRDCLLDSLCLFMKPGGRLDVLDDSSTVIAFDRPGKDKYYDVYITDLKKKEETCLTCNSAVIPQKHNGQPAWHPDGEWIVFQSEKQNHKGRSRYSTPGRGVFCDLWLTNKSGTVFHQLTDLPNSGDYGVLHPHFSKNGKKLSWCEMYKGASLKYKGELFGHFKLKTADFSINEEGVPQLTNIKEYIPGDKVFYENHGFSPDGTQLLFASNLEKDNSPLGGNKLCLLDLETEELTILAEEGYNEHACYIMDGKYILWGSNHENRNKGMDYWIMKPDGTEKQRLTYFNQKGYPESSRKRFYTVDMSWSDEKRVLLGFVQPGLVKDGGMIYIFYFK